MRHRKRQLSDLRLALLYRLGVLPEGRPKVFCIGMQRTGTTSIGDFCETQLGLVRRGNRLSRRLGWSRLWYDGKLERVFDDPYFQTGQIFDDGPWWFPDVYKTLFERFPDAKFCMFARDPDAWFRSLVAHSSGRSPGYTDVHARIYDRQEVYKALARENGGPLPWHHQHGFALEGHDTHYKAIYTGYVASVERFFATHAPDRLFVARLDEDDKFRRLADFLGFQNRAVQEVWSNSIASTPDAPNG